MIISAAEHELLTVWGASAIPNRTIRKTSRQTVAYISYTKCVTVTNKTYLNFTPTILYNKKGGESITDSKMDSKAASRIQSAADKTGTNSDFKARAQSAAAKNERK